MAARTAAIDQARRAGDPQAAKRLAALRKPTVAAWVVNLLAVRRPDLIDELASLSTALRAAQRGLRGDQLRELSLQRRQVVSALVASARQLAQAAEPGIRLPLAEVEATLSAALAEPEIAAQIRTGRLIRAASYAGFGEVPRPRLRLVTDDASPDDVFPGLSPGTGPNTGPNAGPNAGPEDSGAEIIELPAADGGPARAEAALVKAERVKAERAKAERVKAERERFRREAEQRRRELRRELSAALSEERRADEHLERAEEAEREAGHRVEDLDAELAELQRRRAEAQADVARRKTARRSAERETAAARRRVGDVQAALNDLESDEPD